MGLTKKTQCLIGCVALLTNAGCAAYTLTRHIDLPKDLQVTSLIAFVQSISVWYSAEVLICLISGGILLRIYRLNPANCSTYRTIFYQYIARRVVLKIAEKARRKIERGTMKFQRCQEKLLMEILREAKGSAYASDMKLDGIKTVEDYIRRQPLTDYAHIKPYIDRAIAGESNMLYKDKVDYFAATSGTSSGASKLYPISRKRVQKIGRREWYGFVWEMKHHPRMDNLRRRIQLGVRFEKQYTDNGVEIGPISAMAEQYYPENVTPRSGMEIKNMESAFYVQNLFALVNNDVSYIVSAFSSHILSYFRVLENRWDDICFDIQMGKLGDSIELPDNIRTDLNKHLKPNRTRAIELRREFARGFNSIAPRLWPDMALAVCVATGSFKIYADILKEKYLGDVPIYTSCHNATEGTFGIVLKPLAKNVQYTLFPNTTFYEFIPVEDIEETPTTVLGHEVVVGKEYELVATTLMGMYRYRLKDIVRIVGHYNETPMYEFVRRRGDILDLFGEKTTSAILDEAITPMFSESQDLSLLNYTCTESTNVHRITGENDGLYYVLFVEIFDDVRVTKEDAKTLDDNLCKVQNEYGVDRKAERIYALRVIQVRTGIFEKFKHLIASSNSMATYTQVKIPRVTRRDDHIQLLLDGVL